MRCVCVGGGSFMVGTEDWVWVRWCSGWGGEGKWLWNFRTIDQEGGRQAPSGNTAMPLVPMV